MSEFGTKRTCRGGLTTSAVEGRTDMPFKQGHFRVYARATIADVVETLKTWGVLRSGIHVQ